MTTVIYGLVNQNEEHILPLGTPVRVGEGFLELFSHTHKPGSHSAWVFAYEPVGVTREGRALFQEYQEAWKENVKHGEEKGPYYVGGKEVKLHHLD